MRILKPGNSETSLHIAALEAAICSTVDVPREFSTSMSVHSSTFCYDADAHAAKLRRAIHVRLLNPTLNTLTPVERRTLTLEAPKDAPRRRSLPGGAGAAAAAAATAALIGLPGLPTGSGARTALTRSSAPATAAAAAAGSSSAGGSGLAPTAALPSNEAGLAPLRLPAQLRAFSRVPVVLSAGAGGAAARPFDISVRLLLPAQ